MIVLKTPKGWTGPKFVDGLPVEGTWRAHQVPLADFDNPEHLAQLQDWMLSYRPRELFDEHGKFREVFAAIAPTGHRRMSANPHANGGELLSPLAMPHFRDYAVEVAASRRGQGRSHPRARDATCATSSSSTWPAATSASSAPTRPPPTAWTRSTR